MKTKNEEWNQNVFIFRPGPCRSPLVWWIALGLLVRTAQEHHQVFICLFVCLFVCLVGCFFVVLGALFLVWTTQEHHQIFVWFFVFVGVTCFCSWSEFHRNTIRYLFACLCCSWSELCNHLWYFIISRLSLIWSSYCTLIDIADSPIYVFDMC